MAVDINTIDWSKFGQIFKESMRSQNVEPFNPIDKLNMPPIEEVIDVGQNQVGYLTQDMPRKYILTCGLAPCIGIYTRNPLTGTQTLAHVCGNLASKTRAFGVFLRQRNLVLREEIPLSNNQLINILQSPTASDKDVGTIVSSLQGYGYNNIKVKKKTDTPDNELSISVIYDSEGSMHELVSIRPWRFDNVGLSRMEAIAFSPSLHVLNEDRYLEDPTEDKFGYRNKLNDINPDKDIIHKDFNFKYLIS